METVELKLEESNELLFRLAIEGTRSQPSTVRFVCESDDGMSYMFDGSNGSEPGEVKFIIPAMQKHLAEGNYTARLEVLVENRYFSPIELNVHFKKGIAVVAETVKRPLVQQQNNDIKVSSTSIIAKPSNTVQNVQSTQPKKSITLSLKERAEARRHLEQSNLTEEELEVSENDIRRLAKQLVFEPKVRNQR